MRSYLLRYRHHYYSDSGPFPDLVALFEKTVEEITRENQEIQGVQF